MRGVSIFIHCINIHSIDIIVMMTIEMLQLIANLVAQARLLGGPKSFRGQHYDGIQFDCRCPSEPAKYCPTASDGSLFGSLNDTNGNPYDADFDAICGGPVVQDKYPHYYMAGTYAYNTDAEAVACGTYYRECWVACTTAPCNKEICYSQGDYEPYCELDPAKEGTPDFSTACFRGNCPPDVVFACA